MHPRCYYKLLKFSELKNMVNVPNYQRLRDDTHVKDIKEYHLLNFRKLGNFDILGSISLGKIPNSKYYEILDGQHRMNAYEQLYDDINYEFYINVLIYQRDTAEELEDVFARINMNKPVPIQTEIYTDMIIINQTVNWVKTTFSKYIKPSKKPHSPNINLETLYKEIVNSNIIAECGITSSEMLIEEIIKLNRYLTSITLTEWLNKLREIGISRRVSDSIFRIGFYQNYEWLGFIIEHKKTKKEYDKIKMFSIKNLLPIPKQIRFNLWSKYFDTSTLGKCYICDKNIDINNFEAGHVVSRAYGGLNKIENLRPLCKICNNDMGTTNLEKYKENFIKE